MISETSYETPLAHLLLPLAALLLALSFTVLAQPPGSPFPSTAEAGDQKAGSVLIFSLYSSSATDPEHENTEFSVVNMHPTAAATLHVFFVDGSSCSASDVFVTINPNRMWAASAASFDPGARGFIIAVAVNQSGQPEREALQQPPGGLRRARCRRALQRDNWRRGHQRGDGDADVRRQRGVGLNKNTGVGPSAFTDEANLRVLTLTATVSGAAGTPEGIVTLYDGATTLGRWLS